MIEDRDKKAKITSILGIVLFPTVPLSYLSAVIFSSLHPLINSTPGESGFIYWNPIKLSILIFNLIAITVFFIYVVLEFTEVDKARDQLNEIIQRRLEEE